MHHSFICSLAAVEVETGGSAVQAANILQSFLPVLLVRDAEDICSVLYHLRRDAGLAHWFGRLLMRPGEEAARVSLGSGHVARPAGERCSC